MYIYIYREREREICLIHVHEGRVDEDDPVRAGDGEAGAPHLDAEADAEVPSEKENPYL